MASKTNTKGISLPIVLAVVAVIAVLLVGGYFVWQRNKDDDKSNTNKTNNTSQGNKSSDSKKQEQPNALALDDDSVKFTLPESWTFTKGEAACNKDESLGYTCHDGAIITPGEKLPTRYGNGTEFFNINVSVFDNPNHSDAQDWLLGDTQTPYGLVDSSKASVNGYDSYFQKTSYDGDGTTVGEVQYVFTVGDKAVLVYARTYEPGTLNDGTKVGDFRKFETSIAEMAQTVVIK